MPAPELAPQRVAPAQVVAGVLGAVLVVAGLIGVGLHFNGAAEFQRDIDPSIAWWPLVTKVARSQSPPLLAPAAMVQLGLIGLVYAFRHPVTGPAGRDFNEVNR